jgi:hypothetical protein
MAGDPLRRILREHGEDLLTVLAERISPTDLQSLLLEVYRFRGSSQPLATLLEQHQENRFLKPSPMDPRVTMEFDSLAFALATPKFQPIELSPLAPLGATSAVTNVSQNNLVSTSRNSEVMADPTNVMALECAIRRRQLLKDRKRKERVRLCCSQRVTRAQYFSAPNSWAHFRLFAMVSAGQDEGSCRFESEELTNQIAFHLDLLHAWPHKAYSVRVMVTNFDGAPLAEPQNRVIDDLRQRFPDANIHPDTDRQSGRTYYEGLCFQIHLTDAAGEEFFLVDGGITNWTQRLLSNMKERFVISGLGTERFCALFGPPSSPL